MNGSRLPEGTPILCRNCRGGMTLHADGSIVCRYCGARDQLPADELGRVLEIKNRLAQAEQRAAQLKGFDATFAGVFEKPGSFARVMGVYVALGLLVAVMAGYQLFTTFFPNANKLGNEIVVEVVLGQLMGPLFLLGFGFSLGAALLTGRRHYRRSVRPLLIAGRPVQPNAALACRACGGALPAARSADVHCAYCRTVNLVPQELHGSHADALFQEAEAAKQQLYRAQGALVRISSKMRTTLILCSIATLVIAFGLPMLGMAVWGKH